MERGTKGLLGGALLGMAVGLPGLMLSATAQAADAQAILKDKCATCHEVRPDGSQHRVSDMRKTPEGWEMTLFRMNNVHKAGITADEAAVLIKHLSDTQGLAPSETTPYRAVLEREPAAQEVESDPLLVDSCARCHSSARVGLERRDEAEWLKLAHFHLGQFPTAEYQLLARDREWWKIISTEIPPLLAKRFPFQTAAWDAWKAKPKADLSGTWVVAGHEPGKGAYGGLMTITKGSAPDTYGVAAALTDADGTAVDGEGQALVFTGYEWRASLSLGGKDSRQIMALSEDGTTLSGRAFDPVNDELGSRLTAVRAGDAPVLAGLSATSLKAGTSATVTLYGNGLKGVPDFGKGVTTKLVGTGPGTMTVTLTAAKDAAVGPRAVTVGDASLADALVVYKAIDRVAVEPAVAVGRVGGNGGKTAPMLAQAEAIGFLNGPDGKPETEDDLRLGPLPATWTVGPMNEAAELFEDVKFAGAIDASGLFTPAVAGPNKARVYGTNNVGDLKLTASVQDGARTLSGDGRLVITVQRWVDPPIR